MGDSKLIWLIHFAAWVYAMIQIWKSNADTAQKLLWTLIVFFLPVVGLIAWYFMGPGTPKK